MYYIDNKYYTEYINIYYWPQPVSNLEDGKWQQGNVCPSEDFFTLLFNVLCIISR